MKISFIVSLIAVTGLYCANSSSNDGPIAQSNESINHNVLTAGLDHPWEILWGPDNMIWMTERDGRISKVDQTTGKVTPVYFIRDVESNGEGGLLGMALHPAFTTNPYVYVAYNHNSNGSYRESIVRYTYTGGTLAAPKILLSNIMASGIHNGCRLIIKEDKLFITTGDAANASSAQDLKSLNGKVLRLNLDGSVPADNPIPGSPLWSWGHRNAQGAVFIDNNLFISEHGPDTDDEINIVQKGRNYGWPNTKGYCDTDKEMNPCKTYNITEPIKTWSPTAAVCGMDYYNNSKILSWNNSLLVTALKNSRLYILKLNAERNRVVSESEVLNNKYGRLRDVCVAPDGKVFVSTSNGGDDKIIVLSPK